MTMPAPAASSGKPFFIQTAAPQKQQEPAKNPPAKNPPAKNPTAKPAAPPGPLQLSAPVSKKDAEKNQEEVGTILVNKGKVFQPSNPSANLAKITKPTPSIKTGTEVIKPEKAKVEIKPAGGPGKNLDEAVKLFTKKVQIDGKDAGYSVENKTFEKLQPGTRKMLLDHFQKQGLVAVGKGGKTYYVKPAYAKAVKDSQ